MIAIYGMLITLLSTWSNGLLAEVWTAQPTSGEKPPPLDGHSFIKIDHHKAVVFGGFTGKGYLDNTYILDMETWV